MVIVTFIGRFHPVVVHLPIGFLILAAILKVLNVRFPKRFSDLDKAIGISLFLGAASGLLACVLGYSLSLEGGYDANTIFWHKWLGIGVVIVALASWIVHERYSNRNSLSHALFAVFSVLLLLTGHLGGNLTHGSDYLLVHAPALVQNVVGYNSSREDDIEIPKELNSIGVFTHLVKPILETKCVSCHNPSKSKGGLDMTTEEGILAGGDDGSFISAGDTHESGLFTRVTLNPRSKKYMPPSGESMSYNEIKLIEWWIKEGASLQDNLGGKEIPEGISYLLWQEYKIDTKPKEFYDQIVVNKLNEEVLNTLASSGFKVSKISTQHELLDVRMGTAASGTATSLSSLLDVKDHVIWLDLSEETIEPDEWERIASLKNLNKLNLNKSSIADADLQFVEDLNNLEVLNLYGTSITDESVKYISNLKKLKRIYLWDTKYTPVGIALLQESLPELEIIFES